MSLGMILLIAGGVCGALFLVGCLLAVLADDEDFEDK